MENITVKLLHDTRHTKSDGIYPIRIRVTFEGRQSYYPTGISLTEKQHTRMMNTDNPGDDLKDKRSKLRKLVSKAEDLTSKATSFNYLSFKDRMDDKEKTGLVKEHFDEYIDELKTNGQIKTKRNYESALVSFVGDEEKGKKGFKAGWLLKEVTKHELDKYYRWMVAAGKSKTTISMYTRCMRTIINNAIAADEFSGKYPFGRRGFDIPAPRSKKNPLTTDDFNALANYKTDDPEKAFGRDMWLLCYYCGGRNYADLLSLTYKDVTETTITFPVRQKTIATRENQTPLVVNIHDELREILDRYAQENKSPKTFVFPIYKNGKPEQLVNLRSDFGKRCNAALQLISADLKVNPIKMQQSRHTALNELKRQNLSKEEIRVIAGHASDKTTELYLESMDDAVVNNALNLL